MSACFLRFYEEVKVTKETFNILMKICVKRENNKHNILNCTYFIAFIVQSCVFDCYLIFILNS